ncbi:MAG TPA: class I SAM-dependent methyltransferase [Rhodocyclaceae bacterium]|jgi:SAM-dependent methyltransferase
MTTAPPIPAKSNSPLRAALFTQLAGLFAAAVLVVAKPALMNQLLVLAGFQGFFAAWMARLQKAPIWWQAIHLLFFPLMLVLNELHLPPLLWLGSFGLLFLVYWRTDTSQVPLYLSNRATGTALAQLIPAEPCFVIDLGCGTGGLLCLMARLRPDCHFTGIEHAPIPYLIARWHSRKQDNIHIRHGDLWTVGLGACQLVYAFLSPVPMPRLWQKAKEEMVPGALLVSNSFEVPDVEPEQIIAVDDSRQTQLYCYRPGQTVTPLAE